MSEVNQSLSKVESATKWSLITELGAKLLAPITSSILARILVPEAFGLVATINMVISFTDIFTDAGFQKYIIQREFEDDRDREEYINVAFWSNLVMSLFLMLVLMVFRTSIAELTGSPGLGLGIAIASLNLPITSFSSIRTAIFRRNLDFKTLFYVRISSALIPLIVTIPIALFTRTYWALVIGTLCGNLTTATILTIKSTWHPQFCYSFAIFKEMFSYCYWILIECILIWVTSYIGTFIVGRYLSSHDLGIYKTSMSTVNQIVAIVTSATAPVIFSVTCRLQKDKEKMCELFLDSLRIIGLVLIPMGFGIFLYSDFITSILLGSQWMEAVNFIGLWGICSVFGLVLSSYWDGMFNAIGKPVYSVLTQLIYLVILVPMLVYGAKQGYQSLYILRCLSRVIYIFIQLITVKYVFNIKILKSVSVVIPSVLCCIPMILFALVMSQISVGIMFEFVKICLCILIYFITGMVIPSTRKDIIFLLSKMNIRFTKELKDKEIAL